VRFSSPLAATVLASAAFTVSGGPSRQQPVGVAAPSGHHWVLTFDDEFTQDSSLAMSKWNYAEANTNGCTVPKLIITPGYTSVDQYNFATVGYLCCGIRFDSTN
jgi:hypothetical protein